MIAAFQEKTSLYVFILPTWHAAYLQYICKILNLIGYLTTAIFAVGHIVNDFCLIAINKKNKHAT